MHIKLSFQFLRTRKRDNSQELMEIDQEASSLQSTRSANVWTIKEEQRLISLIAQHKGRSGDGLNFIMSFWKQIAEEPNKYCTRGTLKNAKTCMSKWSCVGYST